MSLDVSLKGRSTLVRHRNVLRRAERIVALEESEKWTEEKNSVFGIVKVGHRKAAPAKKAPKAAAAADGTTPAAGAVAGGKAAAAPAGGKAVPAAKPAAKK